MPRPVGCRPTPSAWSGAIASWASSPARRRSRRRPVRSRRRPPAHRAGRCRPTRPSVEPCARSLLSVVTLERPDLVHRSSGFIVVARNPPVCDAIVRIEVWVMSSAPPISTSTSTTPAATGWRSASSGSAMSAPSHPPASSSGSISVVSPSGPRTIWSRPSTAPATRVHPTASRNALDEVPRRTNDTPTTTRITGMATRPSPASQPKSVSMPRPSGPARLK